MKIKQIVSLCGLFLGLIFGNCLAQSDAENYVTPDVVAAYEAYTNGDIGTAHDLFLAESENGNPLAQYEIGALYFQGAEGIPADHERSLFWLKKSADAGCSVAACAVVNFYIGAGGQGVDVDHNSAIDYLPRCASAGQICRGQWRQVHREAAELLLRQYAAEGYASAQYELAEHLGNVHQTVRMMPDEVLMEYVNLLEAASEQGHVHARVSLGSLYLYVPNSWIWDDVSKSFSLGTELIFGTLIENPTDPDLARRIQERMVLVHFPEKDGRIKNWVWAKLVELRCCEEKTKFDEIIVAMGQSIGKDLTDDELAYAQELAATWHSLFESGLPDVTVEQLRDLNPPMAPGPSQP